LVPLPARRRLRSRTRAQATGEAILHKMQQAVYERTIYAPSWQLAFINGVGPRVSGSGFGLIPHFPYTAPYEDITLKGA
jgi:peptide/nickel transport system substrate-binding protein